MIIHVASYMLVFCVCHSGGLPSMRHNLSQAAAIFAEVGLGMRQYIYIYISLRSLPFLVWLARPSHLIALGLGGPFPFAPRAVKWGGLAI